ncbi:DUF551 domain-containing protein [Escherichia coli]|uniref:DUF551 domain-containing protein n=1 Tax=Escherichia coli TaxID=562 RepID=UPI0018E55861|nr:DUF551 domain-containing protein [Escherichia coli]
MTELTKEQLIEEAKLKIAIAKCHPNSGMARVECELFKIALASLEAEPVASCIIEDGGMCVDGFGEYVGHSLPDGMHELYAAPPAPAVPAVLERLRAIVADPRALPRRKEWVSGQQYSYVLLENVEAMVDEACRAAMLHGAKPVSQTYKLNKLSGNSPVTPDGWISCSKRMPEKNQNVLISVNFDSSLVEPLICSARYTGSTFRRGEATIKPGNGIEQATHWMPLPEPPQEVN